ncbi:histidine decarboxylase [Streptomyces chartreusis]
MPFDRNPVAPPQPACPSPRIPLRQLRDPHLHIGPEAGDTDSDIALLLKWAGALKAEQPHVLGYPGSLDFDYAALAPLLSVLANNVGDPASADASAIHAKAYEQAVIDYFAQSAGSDPDAVYGYLTTGGTEGLLFGMATARTALPHAPVYASDQAHYSVGKAARLLGLQLITVVSRPDGTMDPDDLRSKLHQQTVLAPRNQSPGAIVLATIGTTMRGAYDDVTLLRDAAAMFGEVYVHADAALGGFIAAHAPSLPRWSFRHGADSVSISGHKMIGMPVPCGVVLARRHLVPDVTSAEYVQATDRTLGCSRSGLAAVLMWSALRRLGHTGMRTRVLGCLDVARYAADRLAAAGARPSRPTDSVVVCFDRPPPEVVDRWHLACEGDRAHIVTVAHVDRAAVDELCADLSHMRR